ncbi:MAG: hypothetical protein FWC87_07915 [Acidimicrobiaceae bacterium]|nr:hypothetical protein [Acidimicrobiaceae bacterium]
MTWAVNHPNRQQRLGSTTWTAAGATTRPVRVPWVGFLIALLGAWAGIVAFVGPAFGYEATATSTWQWTTANWLLHLIPGAMALVAGLGILAWTTDWGSLRARGVLAIAALLAIVAGGWLVIGPALWPWFQSSPAYGPAADAGTSFLHQVGANLGPGLLLAMLGGMALKTALAARRMAGGGEPVAGAPAAGGTDTTGVPEAGGYPDPATADPATADPTMTDPASIRPDLNL